MFHYHTGTMSRKVGILNSEVSTGFIEINPFEARKHNIEDNEMVSVQSRRGKLEISIRITERVSEGVVFIPFHFVECAANLLTNSSVDPIAKIPEYKVCAVKIEKLKKEL